MICGCNALFGFSKPKIAIELQLELTNPPYITKPSTAKQHQAIEPQELHPYFRPQFQERFPTLLPPRRKTFKSSLARCSEEVDTRNGDGEIREERMRRSY